MRTMTPFLGIPHYVIRILVLPVVLLGSSASEASLIAHWTGDGTTLDASGNSHDGTLVNGATYGTGVLGQAFSFDGVNDYVTVPGNAALEPSILSVAMWVNASATGGIRLLADSSHGGTGGVNQNGWALQLNGAGQLSFAYGNGSVFPEVTSSTVVADGTFHHVVAILNGTTMQIFVDGSSDGTGIYSGTPTDSTANSGNIRLGDHYQLSRPLNGLLDDVRIYDHALGQTEVSALFNVPEPSSLVLSALSFLVLGMSHRRSE
ncbi:MAG: LamG domain-containing protein [bacterium]|nr:LamG domain-containing protein [bacterium]